MLDKSSHLRILSNKLQIGRKISLLPNLSTQLNTGCNLTLPHLSSISIMDWASDDGSLNEADLQKVFRYQPQETRVVKILPNQCIGYRSLHAVDQDPSRMAIMARERHSITSQRLWSRSHV
ncbi:hypothetical protein CaCOL14_007176 [Colletotrichum acutatum]